LHTSNNTLVIISHRKAIKTGRKKTAAKRQDNATATETETDVTAVGVAQLRD